MKRRSFNQSDHIRLNLQWLDRRESLQTSIIRRIFVEMPVLPLSLAMIAGILIAVHLSVSSVCTGLLIVLPAACGFLLTGIYKFSARTKLYLTFTGSVFLFIALGAGRFAAVQYRPPRHISHILQSENQLATLRGRVISPVRINDQNRGFSGIPWLNSQSSFYLAVTAIKTPSGQQPVCGNVRVQVNERVEDIRPGNEIQIYCRLSRFSPPANPGQFDLQKYMNGRGVFVAASVPIAESIEIIDADNSAFFRLRSALYRFSAKALLDETATDPDVYAMVSALLLGQRGSLDPAIVSAFQKTNLAHFISLSGMHVGILAGSLWILLRMAQLPKRPRAVLCMILILTYAMIVPPRAPTMRAVFLSCFFFASTLLHRRVHPLNTLALSAMVLLFFRPYELFSPGWQLSFLSVLGILLFYKTVQFQILDRLFYPFVLLLNKRFVWFQHFLYGIVELLAVGISAWIVIAPILLYYFGRVNPLSPVWTVLVFPAVLLILYAGFLKIALSALLPTLATALGALLNLLVHVLEKMVFVLAKVDFLQIASHRPGILYIVILYLMLAGVCLMPYHYRRSRHIALPALVVCFLFPWLTRISSLKNGPLEMACLSVGHGQAVVVSTPTGEHLLFDAGSITHQQIARKIIQPYLQHRRIFQLDAVYISHGDLDHLNAVPDIAAAVNIGSVYGNAAFLENTRQPSLEQSLRNRLEQIGNELRPIVNCRYGEVTIKSLWPLDEAHNADLSENDRSQVFLLVYAGRKILLCGDVEIYAQKKLLDYYPALDIDVMVLPHHGSTNNLDTRFIEQLAPEILIASGGRRYLPNAYRPPEGWPARCFYTPADGAVTVKIKPDGTFGAAGFLNAR